MTQTPSMANSKVPVWSPDINSQEYNDISKMQRPLLGSKVKYSKSLQKKISMDQHKKHAQEISNK